MKRDDTAAKALEQCRPGDHAQGVEGYPMPLSANDQAKLDLWKRVLDHHKLPYTVDEEAEMVEFPYQDLRVIVPLEDSDPTFFALLVANIWPLTNDVDRSVAAWMASRLSAEVKTAKVFLNPDGVNVSVACEMFFSTFEQAEAVLRTTLGRLLEVCAFARQRFGQAMQQPRAARAIPMPEAFGSAATGPMGPAAPTAIPMPSIGPLGVAKKEPSKPN